MKKRTVAALKWAGIVVVAFGVLYVILLVSANRKLSRAYAALESDGRPMKAWQIIPADVADQDNAALLYQAAVLRLKSETGSDKEKSIFDQLNAISYKILGGNPPPTQTDWDTFRKLIAVSAFADTMALWESGLDKPYCLYERDYNAGPDIRYTGVTEHRVLFQAFGVTALIRAQDGDGEGAWALIEKLFRFADHLKTEPTLIDQLLRMGLFATGEKTMNQIASISLPREEMFATLDRQLQVFEKLDLFMLAMDGERLLQGEWVFDFASKMSPFEQIRWIEQIGRRYGDKGAASVMTAGLLVACGQPVLRLDHAMYLEIMNAQTQPSAMQYGPNKDTLADEMISRIPRYYLVSGMLTATLLKARHNYFSQTVQATVARAGLAVLHFHLQQGRFPETLAETGQTFSDPFSGKELVYRQDDAGFVVYSIGPNQLDDGGLEKPDYAGDIAWKWGK